MTTRPTHVLASDNYTLMQVYDWLVESPTFYNRVEDCVLIALVAEHPNALEWMRKPPKAVMEAAVRYDPCNIGRISNPPKDIQLIAVSLDPSIIEDRFIRNPCEEAVALAALIG